MNCNNNMCNLKKPEHYMHNCECLDELPLAIAYVPWQKWQKIYDAEKGLYRGTIFQELDLPFLGIGGCQK